ncbi:hypothetical protein D3C86_1516120 [compost metagenome]
MSVHFGYGFSQRIHPGRFQTLAFAFDTLQLLVETRPAFIIDQTQLAAHFSQTQIGVVFTQHQTIFRP